MRAAVYLVLLCVLMACSTDRHAEKPQGLEQLRGQWVLINYWARWCKPCIEEIPELNELDHKHEDITVLGVNYDGATGEALAEQVEHLGVEFTTLERDPAADPAAATAGCFSNNWKSCAWRSKSTWKARAALPWPTWRVLSST